MEIPLPTSLDIHAFSGSGISDHPNGMTNVIVHNGKEITQRPSIDIQEDSSTIGTLNDRARGIYYWEENAKLYIVHDNDLYETTQDSIRITENSGTFSTGTERVTMLESLGTPRLIIIDSENNKLWVMTAGKVLDQVTTNVPATIVYGGAVLDGYLFIMDEAGVIYNSDINAPQTLGALSFITAERDNDKGVYLGKHHDNIVAIGTKTTEFLYDAGNAVGSPLNRRQDISYNIGCADGLGVWENGDIIYFVGSGTTGQIQLWKLENFQLQPISPNTLNSYLTQTLTQSGLRIIINGVSAMGNDTILFTIYDLLGTAPGTITPKLTFSFDTVTNLIGFWTTDLNSLDMFPLIAFTKRTGGQNATDKARTGEGIFHNGDIFSVNDKLIPVDTLLGSDGVYEDGVYETDIYVSSSSDVGTNIPITVRTGLVDGGIREYKFQNFEYAIMEKTKSAQTLTVKHSDESSVDFGSGNTIDVSQDRKELWQGGRFMKRNYQLEYSGDEQIFIESFHSELQGGT